MQRLTAPLLEMPEYEELKKRMRTETGVLSLTGCIEGQKAHFIDALSQETDVVLAVTENDLSGKILYENLRYYDPDVLYYPAKDLLFYEADVASNQLDQSRMEVYRAMLTRNKGERLKIVLPVAALMDFVTKKELLNAQLLSLRIEEEHEFEDIKRTLVMLGYERCAEVEQAGQFAFRGDLLDIWILTEDHPVRIEFWGDEIDNMRYFDAESQRSIEELEEITVFPANDHTGETAPFIKWFNLSQTQIFLDEPNRLIEAASSTEEEFRESIRRRAELKDESLSHIPELLSVEKLTAALNRLHCVGLSMLEMRRDHWSVVDVYSLSVQSVSAYNNRFEYLMKDLASYQKRGYRVIVLSGSHTRAQRLAKDLVDNGIAAGYSEDHETPLVAGQISVEYGHVSRGFEYPLIRFAVISETDIFGEKRPRRKKKKSKYSGKSIATFNELSVGDYVIHESYGLGIYRGIDQIEVDGAMKDYIKLEYNGSNLFILATQLDALQKYANADAKEGKVKPKLNRIGGAEWQKTKARVRSSVQNIAGDLIALYAKREAEHGFVYSADTQWQKEFEEMFPYEETEDQLQAIEDTKHDMESKKIMDRLICGDVGFGKTEIAIRAAFKAVQDSKQVVYLVPTTILAQQHFNTFAQRMKDYPIRVAMLSRFRTAAQNERTISDLKKGLVDIVIGTHRLLSKDVRFKDLGLLIIDEEQRFGVAAKEKIKKLRENVDVLTLTATPIPRTLHMSLIGIRDMSILEEAPQDRSPIQTYVMEFNPEMIREAICREMARGGQIYYVYNRVRDIADMAGKIQKLVPEATVAYADGQMAKNDLEDIMVSFVNGEIDVLVTTTIIETGLDISNANTMIIHDADRFGLSQLYQLRGRVGRSNRSAYTFLMYRRDKMLKEVAEKRLAAIKEFTALGSGFKIAMRDLEIRGAGNLLGAEQSGHIEAVGYDLYCKMLATAVAEAKGEKVEEEFETVVDLTLDAYIPDRYIPNEFQKLDFYKKIAAIENDEDYENILDELLDRYGPVPNSVRNLMNVARVKAKAHLAGITEIKQVGDNVRISMKNPPLFDVTQLPAIIARHKGHFSVHQKAGNAYLMYHGDLSDQKETLSQLHAFSAELAQTGAAELDESRH